MWNSTLASNTLRSSWRMLLAGLCVVGASERVGAELTLPAVISDHMVLQSEADAPLWGWATPGAAIQVRIADRDEGTIADDAGRWSLKASTRKLSAGPHRLTVSGDGGELVVEDVLIGEVWLASGQSNMAMPVSRALNAKQEISAADYPQIRMFTTARQSKPEPQDRCQGKWVVCQPSTAGGFSATAYFFGRHLHRELGRPVGLINSSWGGTAVEAWTSVSAQQQLPAAAPLLKQWSRQLESKPELAANQNRPGNLFNGMIHPLIPYGIRGAIWYQGERNRRGPAEIYGQQLAALIGDWRSRWKQSSGAAGTADFPFIWAQLPNFTARQTEPTQPDGWVLVQEGMRRALATPNTGMAVTIDVGDARDIHPGNKQAVGKRLALWALGTTYRKDLVYSGPLLKSAERAATPGGPGFAVSFDHVGEGLQAEGPLRGFAIAAADRKFVWAEARIVEGSRVLVWSKEIAAPEAVRYNWAPNPVGNLYNSAGLPASLFRTDDWKD